MTTSQAVRERIPELAVLKCLGFTDRTVLGLVLAESFLLCFIGALFGLLLASAVTGLLPPEYPIKADARVWLFALATTEQWAMQGARLRLLDRLGAQVAVLEARPAP